MKKLISLFLALILALSCATAALASDGGDGVPCIVMKTEQFCGAFASVFARLFGKIKGSDEADIAKASPASPRYREIAEDYSADYENTVYAETWVCSEISFESSEDYADPFSDNEVTLVLSGCGREYSIPCFWDGGRVWKARFACPLAGVWYYKTVPLRADAGLTVSGRVICSEYTGDLDIYTHGFVTTAAGEKYFTYDDGTPFFYLADTHWSLGDETPEIVETVCARREEQGFTVFQSEPIGEKFDLADGVTDADLAGFRNYDEKFEIIASHGLVHANAEFFFPSSMDLLISNFGGCSGSVADGKNGIRGLSDGVKEYLRRMTRYWVARYGAYPVMWTLGQECDDDFYWSSDSHPSWNYANNPYRLVAEYIGEYDAYSHPLSAHQEHSGSVNALGRTAPRKTRFRDTQPSAFNDVTAHDWFAVQWTPSKTRQSDFSVEKEYWYNASGKPCPNFEGQYCYLWTKNFGARMQGWCAYLNGMYGVAWGGQDTWSYTNIYDEGNDSSDGVDTITSAEKTNATWRDALGYESAYQLGYMREFLGRTEWYGLIPRFDNRAYFKPCADVYYVYAGNRDNTEAVIYFYSFTDETVAEKINTKAYGGVMTGTVGSLVPKAEYTLSWFSPVTGGYCGETTAKASAFGTLFIGERPCPTDMALHIVKND